mgnify:CR=1 FL=1
MEFYAKVHCFSYFVNNSFKYIGYPLLGKTLSHSFDYLWIRLNLEYKLYSEFATVRKLVNKNKKIPI